MAKAVKRNFLCMSAQREACVRDRIFRRREDDTTCSYGLLPPNRDAAGRSKCNSYSTSDGVACPALCIRLGV